MAENGMTEGMLMAVVRRHGLCVTQKNMLLRARERGAKVLKICVCSLLLVDLGRGRYEWLEYIFFDVSP